MPRRSARAATVASTVATASSVRQRVGHAGPAANDPVPGPSGLQDVQRDVETNRRSRSVKRSSRQQRASRGRMGQRERSPIPHMRTAQHVREQGECCYTSSDESAVDNIVISSHRRPSRRVRVEITSESEQSSSESDDDSYFRPRNPFGVAASGTTDTFTPRNPAKRRKRTTSIPPPMLETLLSVHVDRRMKRKIWRGDFVEFSRLLPNLGPNSDDRGRVTIDADTGLMTVRNSTETRRINSIHTWLDAFFVYTDVVLERFPDMARQLLHYGSIIRRLAHMNGFAWLRYDTEFRQAIRFHASLSWMKKDPEIYDRCMDYTRQADFKQPFRSFRNGTAAGGASGGPSGGFCHAYNKEGGCRRQNCSFRHACKKCHKDGHGQTACRAGGPAPQASSSRPARPQTHASQPAGQQ